MRSRQPPRSTEAVIRTADGWIRCAEPLETWVAESAGDVPALLERVEAETAGRRRAAGFLTYESAPAFDRALRAHPPTDLPAAWFTLFGREERIGRPEHRGPPAKVGPWEPALEFAAYERAIARIHTLIERGETYQVNFTFPLRGRIDGDPWSVFVDLWGAQRAPCAAYLDLGSHVLVSASPETFFELQGDAILCRPMKGTRRRGLWSERDDELAAELAASAKDRAENLMIVDMVRNDLGRIADPGSVRPEPMFSVERYPTVHQLTSTVRARTEAPLGSILAALFPSASITGAPKAAAMRIIHELEDGPRGIYTGAIGVVGPGRRARFNVAIRTVEIDRRTNLARYGTGGGIVWDSRARAEFDEAIAKTLILSVEPAEFGLFETLRWTPEGGYALLHRHLHRIESSASYFGIPFDRGGALRALRKAVDPAPSVPVRARLVVDRDGETDVALDALPTTTTPWRVAWATRPIDREDPRIYHKTTDRRLYERALAAAPAADDVLLWNRDGEVTESTRANLVIEREGHRLTPPVRCGLLPGTFRSELLARGEVEETVIRTTDLATASRAWLVNSLRGWIEIATPYPEPPEVS